MAQEKNKKKQIRIKINVSKTSTAQKWIGIFFLPRLEKPLLCYNKLPLQFLLAVMLNERKRNTQNKVPVVFFCFFY